MVCGFLAISVAFGGFVYCTSSQYKARRFKQNHPIISVILILLAGYLLVYMCGAVIVFMFGIAFPMLCKFYLFTNFKNCLLSFIVLFFNNVFRTLAKYTIIFSSDPDPCFIADAQHQEQGDKSSGVRWPETDAYGDHSRGTGTGAGSWILKLTIMEKCHVEKYIPYCEFLLGFIGILAISVCGVFLDVVCVCVCV